MAYVGVDCVCVYIYLQYFGAEGGISYSPAISHLFSSSRLLRVFDTISVAWCSVLLNRRIHSQGVFVKFRLGLGFRLVLTVYIYIVDYGFSPRGEWGCVEMRVGGGGGGLGRGGVCAGERGGGEVELWCGFFGGTGVGRGGFVGF